MAQPLPATPIISVIVATRNRRESLQRFIDGLRGLPDRPAWELIVVDNGSTDGTNALLATSARNLPAIIVNEKQPGKSRALKRRHPSYTMHDLDGVKRAANVASYTDYQRHRRDAK